MAADRDDDDDVKVHFVVKYKGILYITRSIHYYDPQLAGLTADEELAIKYLDEQLDGGDAALLDNSVVAGGGHCVNEIVVPHFPPKGR
jgi:hypothetical protein